MDAKDKLKMIHEVVDKFNEINKKEIREQKRVTPADLLMLEMVQAPYVHALVDARLKHEMALTDIEEAVCALTANMISLLLRSALAQDSGPIALMIGKRMSEKMDDYLYDAIAANFTNTGEGPTDADKIH